MIRKSLLLALLGCMCLNLYSQEGLDELVVTESEIVFAETPDTQADSLIEPSPWKFGGNFSVTFNRIALTNWVAGGENIISGSSALMATANYQLKGNRWENTMLLGFGLSQQGKDGVVRKNEDKIDLSSQYGRKATKHWFYSAFVGFKTQFYEGKKTPEDTVIASDFMAPAYLLASLGMDYKPTGNLNILVSPLTGRLTVVNNQDLADRGSYGVDPAVYEGNVLVTPGAKSRMELGGFIKILYQRKFFKEKLDFRTKLELFSNYYDNPQNVDVNWDLALHLKLGNYITARVNTLLIYDDDIRMPTSEIDGRMSPQIQFKEVYGIGFSYSF